MDRQIGRLLRKQVAQWSSMKFWLFQVSRGRDEVISLGCRRSEILENCFYYLLYFQNNYSILSQHAHSLCRLFTHYYFGPTQSFGTFGFNSVLKNHPPPSVYYDVFLCCTFTSVLYVPSFILRGGPFY